MGSNPSLRSAMARTDTVGKADTLFMLSNESQAIWNTLGCTPTVTVRCTPHNFPHIESLTDTICGLLRALFRIYVGSSICRDRFISSTVAGLCHQLS